MEHNEQAPKIVYRNLIHVIMGVKIVVEGYESGEVLVNVTMAGMAMGLRLTADEFEELTVELAEAKQRIDVLRGIEDAPMLWEPLPPDTLIGDIIRSINEQEGENIPQSDGVCEQGGECSYDFDDSPYLVCKKCGKSLF